MVRLQNLCNAQMSDAIFHAGFPFQPSNASVRVHQRGADRQTAMTLDPIDGPAKLKSAIGKESILQTSSGFTVSISAKLKPED